MRGSLPVLLGAVAAAVLGTLVAHYLLNNVASVRRVVGGI